MNRQRRAGLALAALLAMAAPSAAWAQAHDHGPAQRTIQVAPRAEFRNANHEGVLVHENGRLILYLHRFSDGHPLSGAEVEANVNFISEPMEEIAPGVYAAPAGLTAGRNEVELGYRLGSLPHSVATAITLPARAGAVARNTAAPRSFGLPPWLLIALAGAIYLAVNLLLIGGSGRRPSPGRSA